MSKELKDRLDKINNLFQQKDLEIQKLAKEQGRSPAEVNDLRQKLRDSMNKIKEKSTGELGDNLDSLNSGKSLKIAGAAADTLGNTAKRSALKQLGKKALGVIPFAGAGYAALQGDPAMAAEELAGDIPVVGQAYEAFKPDAAGESVEDERMMLAEDQARKNYDKSPARMDKLQKMFGNRSPASQLPSSSPKTADLSMNPDGTRNTESLRMDEIPHQVLEGPDSSEISGAMQDQIQGEVNPEAQKNKRLQMLLGLKK